MLSYLHKYITLSTYPSYMVDRKKIIEEILNNFYTLRQRMKEKAVKQVGEKGITQSQWFVLGIIEQGTGEKIKDISCLLEMSSSAVTQLVDGLVHNGFVIRQTDKKDRRSVKLTLSPKGKKKIQAMKDKRISGIVELFESLSDEELNTYLALHKKIITQ